MKRSFRTGGVVFHSKCLALVVAATCMVASAGQSQESNTRDAAPVVQLADRGPVFFVAPRPGSAEADVRATSIFRLRVSLHLKDATIPDALKALARESGLQFVYDHQAIPANARTSVSAEHLTIASALNEILLDAGLDVEVAGNGAVTLVRHNGIARATLAAQQGTSSVVGYARDSVTGAGLGQVQIRVDGTAQEVKTAADGSYKLSGLAAGEYRITARRVGYLAAVRSVNVIDGQTAKLNFLLNQPATKLDEVVTTAIGAQRRYQVGNVISTINVDSVAPTAPVTSITDLISGRAPGVEIVDGNGMAGSGGSIRIRGIASISLSTDPIIIVDGIRQDNTPGTINTALNGPTASPNRLNDIDFSQIETIDVLKGPAAATEYGTDAENGVIVITTKRGTSGAPQWHLSGEQNVTGIPRDFPNPYWSWGHLTDGTGTAMTNPSNPTPCALRPTFISTRTSVYGNCIVDSVTDYNPLNNRATSPYQDGVDTKYDLSVAGGSETVRYYVAGNLGYSDGNTRLPPVFKQLAEGVGFPSYLLNKSNTEDQRSIRTNVQIKLGSTADLMVNAAYLSTFQDVPAGVTPFAPYGYSPSVDDSADVYGYSCFGCTPISGVGGGNQQSTNRLTAGMQLTWRPTGWLLATETVGMDHGSQADLNTWSPQAYSFNIYGYAASQNLNNFPAGFISQVLGTTDIYTSDFRTTATLPITSMLRSITSLGIQANMTRPNSITATSFDVSPTNFTFSGAQNTTVTPSSNPTGTLGGYLEQQLVFFDRLFVSGAVRVDAGSGFWNGYTTAAYPKASVSWLAIQNGATTVRFRGALGANGEQPPDGVADQLYSEGYVYYNGTFISGAGLQAPGNEHLKPERSLEYEAGVDATFWNNRVSLEVTGYEKTTHNTLISQSLGFDLGNDPLEENLGEVTNDGLEFAGTVGVIQTRSFNWNVTLNASVNQNKLLDVNNNLLGSLYSYSTLQQNRVGYPLYSYFANSYTYTDLNHDGILEPNEVNVDTARSYAGTSIPGQELSLNTNVQLFRIISASALFDYEGKFKVYNSTAWFYGSWTSLNSYDAVVGQPLWEQARDIASTKSFSYFARGYLEDGTFIRFRELNGTVSLPLRMARRLRVSSLSFTAAVRNLHLWTNYSEGDPEVSSPSGGATVSNPVLGTSAVNDNLRSGGDGAVPLPMIWFFRLNVGL